VTNAEAVDPGWVHRLGVSSPGAPVAPATFAETIIERPISSPNPGATWEDALEGPSPRGRWAERCPWRERGPETRRAVR